MNHTAKNTCLKEKESFLIIKRKETKGKEKNKDK